MLKDHFEEEHGSGYQVVLRINNEGAEVDVIESFYKVFSDRLIGVLGSLSDVQKVHGEEQLSALYRYMKQNEIEFVPLYSAFSSWPNAISFLCKKLKDEKNIHSTKLFLSCECSITFICIHTQCDFRSEIAGFGQLMGDRVNLHLYRLVSRSCCALAPDRKVHDLLIHPLCRDQ